MLMPLISALYLTFASCQPSFLTLDGQTWGTSYHIVYSSGIDLADSIRATMNQVDKTLSMFNDSSEISRINRGEQTIAGPMFAEVFNLSKKVWEISDGMYDTTVGNLSEIWGFGKDNVAAIPSDSLIQTTLLTVGMGECEISSSGEIKKKSPETHFDFSSVAKGYGVDCVGAMLERNGVENYMIEIGGEVLVKGLNPRKKTWRIQIDAPSDIEKGDALHKRQAIIELGPEKTAIASSGNYRNHRTDKNGKRWGHTLSPILGYPVENNILATSIVGPSCAMADALATACMALSINRSFDMLEEEGYQGMILSLSEDSTEIVTMSPLFSSMILK